MKKDIPASGSAVYRLLHKNPCGGNPRESTGTPWKHARGQKQITPALEMGMCFRARRRIPRHNLGATANTGGACIDFSGMHAISMTHAIPA
ncbi:hypothetical protein ACCC98_23695 [Rhizobium pisi]|uniref:hypothetical protein n=1 Tax=Rhizobium pisi TaxID=574561 RepID=UPI0039B00A91